MTDQEIPDPHEHIARLIEERRAALWAKLARVRFPVAPEGSVCDGFGAVAVLGLDGEYEPAACLGCALCREVRPVAAHRSAQVMAALERDVMDEEPM